MTARLPKGWRYEKVARCFDIIGSGTTPRSHMSAYYDGNIPWLQSGDLHDRFVTHTEKCVNETACSDCHLKVYKAPFIAIAMYGASIANLSVVKIDACTNQACCTLCQPRHVIDYSFAFYAMSASRESLLLSAHGGTQPNISRETIRRLKLPIPPRAEQERIAAFLDAKCADVDKAIASKRKQLESIGGLWKNDLLRATTRGLKKSRMCKSGNQLFPEIPVGWKVVRIKSIGTLRYGLGEPPATSDDGIPMIRATDFRAGKIDDSRMVRIDPDDLPKGRDAYLKTGEIIVVRSGAYAGDSTIIPEKYNGYISGYDMVVTITKACPEFIAYTFLSRHVLDDQLLLLSLRAAQPHVNAEQVLNLVLPLPTKQEQVEIAKYLDARRANLDALAANLRKQIETLEQYRKSLIHECVTGARRCG